VDGEPRSRRERSQERGVARVSVNGKPVAGTLLPYAQRGERAEIVAELG
jgi:hypothetical protein